MDTQVTFNLPSELDDELKKLAGKRLVSKSALIRMVLSDHVRSREQPPMAERVAEAQPETTN